MTSVNGAVVWSAKYSSFGEASVDIETVTNNLRFAGQYHDNQPEQHYNRFRYYDPKAGRYFTPDPIGLDGGINLYRYVEGNPVNKTDSEGLRSTVDAFCQQHPGACAEAVKDGTIPAPIPLVPPKEEEEEDCDDDDFCYERWEEESARCSQWTDFKDWGAVSGCQERAAIRRNMCVSNGGSPHPNEPPEWSANDIF